MKKILVILSSTSPFGGSTKSIEPILEQLDCDADYDFGVVLPQTNGVFDAWRRRGWKVYCVNMRHANYPPHQSLKDLLLFPLRFAIHAVINHKAQGEIRRIVKEDKFDIIHTNVGVIDIGYKAAKKCGVKHVWHLREYQELDFGEAIFPSKVGFEARLKDPDNFTIAITKSLKEYFNCNQECAQVIYDGVLDSQIMPIEWNKGKYILFVGRISSGKGIEDVLSAFATLCKFNNNYKLVVAGAFISREYESHIRWRINELHIGDVVEFRGVVDDCSDLMQCAICMIMASYSEGLGRVTIEAMSKGCLVVGRNSMGTKEQFDNGLSLTGQEIGIRYDTQSELSEKLIHVCETGIDPYRSMIESAQQVVYRLYSKTECVKSIKSIYARLTNYEQN